MSKKIDKALKELTKALRSHARVAGAGVKSQKKAQRATARVAAASSAYVEAVFARSELGNPFSEVIPGLPEASIDSLAAERDHLAAKRKTKIEQVEDSKAS